MPRRRFGTHRAACVTRVGADVPSWEHGLAPKADRVPEGTHFGCWVNSRFLALPYGSCDFPASDGVIAPRIIRSLLTQITGCDRAARRFLVSQTPERRSHIRDLDSHA
jgi:hypothetical protein